MPPPQVPTTPSSRATPRPSATVLVLRDRLAGGPEVLLVRRREGAGFAAGAWVFPGGVVEPADRALPASSRRSATLRDRAARLRADAATTLGWHVAGLRETFEEVGLLLARHADGRPPDLAAVDAASVRRRLIAGAITAEGFAAWIADAGLVCDLDALAPYRRMVTPQRSPLRFDTLFLLAAAPTGQAAVVDGRETTELRWERPGDAVQAAREGRLAIIHPTIRALEAIAGAQSARAAMELGRSGGVIPPVLPHVDVDAHGRAVRLLEPGDDGYPVESYAEEFVEWGDLTNWGDVPAWTR